MKFSREDRLALLNSEVYQEYEAAEVKKLAQTTPVLDKAKLQQVAEDTIKKTLSGNATDDDVEFEEHWEDEHEKICDNIKKLDDHVLFELYSMFLDELKDRDIDLKEYEEKFKKEELEEIDTEETGEEEAEEEEMEEVFAFVRDSLVKLAEKAAEKGSVESAYMIERTISELFDK